MSDRLDEAHKELGKVVWSADKMSSTMPRRHHLRWTTDIIDESIKKAAVAGISPDNEDGDDEEYDYEDIHVRCLPLALCAGRAAGLCATHSLHPLACFVTGTCFPPPPPQPRLQHV